MMAIGHSGWIRAKVYKRDTGLCGICGADAAKVQRIIWRISRARYDPEAVGLIRERWGRSRWDSTSLWEADHIQPRSEGGGGEMFNLRTLCRPCHLEVTKAMHARRAGKVKYA